MGNTVKRHPHTGQVIRPLWIRPDGRAMWPILGASPDDPPTDPPPADDPPPVDDPPKDDPPSDDGKGGKDAVLADLAKERDRRQAAEAKLTEAQATQQQQMDAIAKALGLKGDDTPPDAEALTAQVAAEQSKAREAALQLAIYRAASTHEASADALLDSASFLASVKDIDPSDLTAVGAAIKQAVEASDRFKVNAPAPTPPFPGGPRTPAAPQRAGSLEEAVQARYSSNNR